jgi:hypothetical protein
MREQQRRSQSGNEDVALETLIDPELLITIGQTVQVFPDIIDKLAYRDHAITIGIDVTGRERIEEYLGKRTMSLFFILDRDLVGGRGCQHRHVIGSQN